VTDPLRPNPLGLPLDPDPRLPSDDPVGLPGGDDIGTAIDDPVTGPLDRPESPDDRSLDLPGESSDAVDPGLGQPEPQPA
jgi:hypothetical protein